VIEAGRARGGDYRTREELQYHGRGPAGEPFELLAPMPKQVAMNMPSAAVVTIPVSTKPRNPTAKANANADSGTPPAVAG
jgi:hypothetical protein